MTEQTKLGVDAKKHTYSPVQQFKDTPRCMGSCTIIIYLTPSQRQIIKTQDSGTLPLSFSFSQAHTLIIQGEKYSHLGFRIKATFHSGAFFKTLNYSFLEEGCDEAQAFSALTGCFHVWQSTSQPACQLPNQRAHQARQQSSQGPSLLANQPNQPGEQKCGHKTSLPVS